MLFARRAAETDQIAAAREIAGLLPVGRDRPALVSDTYARLVVAAATVAYHGIYHRRCDSTVAAAGGFGKRGGKGCVEY